MKLELHDGSALDVLRLNVLDPGDVEEVILVVVGQVALHLRRIHAAIVVDRDGHKAIVIGKGGESLKRIASEARQDMERLFDGKVYLEIWVKVKSGWNDDERLLKSLGYE